MEKTKNRTWLQRLCKTIVFFAILFCMLGYVSEVLTDRYVFESGMDCVREHRDAYDVLFVGTSLAAVNISNQELYDSYGIAGVSLGTACQPVYLTYYSLQEALQYQTPQVVVYIPTSLYYTTDFVKNNYADSEETYLHPTLDSLQNPLVKYQAILATKELYPQLDEWSYYSTFYYAHKNWETLTKEDFLLTEQEEYANGNQLIYKTASGVQENHVTADYSTVEAEEIEAINEVYLQKMIALCKERGIDFVMVKAFSHYGAEKLKELNILAERYDVPFIDIDSWEIGLDVQCDMYDIVHYNLSGAVKMTDAIGEWLQENYTFADCREDEAYAFLAAQQETFAKQKAAMNLKIDLLKSLTLEAYVDTLAEEKDDDTVVFLSLCAQDTHVDDSVRSTLARLGLDELSIGDDGGSFAAVTGGGVLRQCNSLTDACTLSGEALGVSYRVTSAFGEDAQDAEISLDGVEHMQKGAGLNIVVYNSTAKCILSSVFFDLSDGNAARPAKVKDSGAVEYETDVNVWEEAAAYSSTVAYFEKLCNGDAKFFGKNLLTSVGGVLCLLREDGTQLLYEGVAANWVDGIAEEGVIVYENENRETGIARVDENGTLLSNQIVFQSENLQINPTISKVGDLYYMTTTEIIGNVNNADPAAANGHYTIRLYCSANLIDWNLVSEIVSADQNLEDVDVVYDGKFYVFYEQEQVDMGNSALCVTVSTDASGTQWEEPVTLLAADCDHEPAAVEKRGNEFRLFYSSDKEQLGTSYDGSSLYYMDFDEQLSPLGEEVKISTQTAAGNLLYDVESTTDGYRYLFAHNYLTDKDLVVEETEL